MTLALALNPEWEAWRDRAARVPATPDIAALYAEAFARFGAESLWRRRQAAEPTLGECLVVAAVLRREGGMPAHRLALRIEDGCRAAL